MLYPTANTSGSALLRTITVTSALQSLSFHRLTSSAFFTSQHKTSSTAPTMAFPAPDVRKVLVSPIPSRTHRALDEVDVMSPKVLECSYFLHILAASLCLWHEEVGKPTSMISPCQIKYSASSTWGRVSALPVKLNHTYG